MRKKEYASIQQSDDGRRRHEESKRRRRGVAAVKQSEPGSISIYQSVNLPTGRSTSCTIQELIQLIRGLIDDKQGGQLSTLKSKNTLRRRGTLTSQSARNAKESDAGVNTLQEKI